MAKQVRWVKTPEPYDDESLSSYLGRWARDNHIGSRSTLLSELDVSHSLRPSDQDLQHLGDTMGVPKDMLQRLAPSDTPAIPGLRRSLTRARTEAVCPRCLHDGNYARQVWSHVLATTCATHGLALIDRCPSCAGALMSTRGQANRCDCGHDLRRVEAGPATEVEIEFAALLSGKVVDVPNFPLRDCKVVPPDIDMFMLGLANHVQADVEPSAVAKPGKSAHPRTVDEARARMAPALALMQNWPHRFQAQVDQWMARPGRSSTVSVNRRLGPWYNFLFQKFSGPAYAAWREAAANVIVKSNDGLANVRTSNLFNVATVQKDWFTLAEAARALQIRAERLMQGIDDGRIQASCHDEAPGYRQRFISRLELDRLKEVRHAHIDVKEAGQLLAVPMATLTSLLEAGLAETANSSQLAPVTRGVIVKRSLHALMHRLKDGQPIIDATTLTAKAVPLRSLNLRRTTDRHKLHQLFVAINDGSLNPVGIDGSDGIGGVLFDDAEVDRRLLSRVVERSLTAQQVAILMDTHYDAVTAWIQAGVLAATRQTQAHGRPWLVTIEALVTFLRHHVILADHCKALGTTSRGITKRLAQQGIAPMEISSNRGQVVLTAELLAATVSSPVLEMCPCQDRHLAP